MKTKFYDKAADINRSDPYWRFEHGFDNIDPNPCGWPIVAGKYDN